MNIDHVRDRVRAIHIGLQHGNPTVTELTHLLYRDVLVAIADGRVHQPEELAYEALKAEPEG